MAILLYLFSSSISDNFVFVFVFVILLLSFDFWTVKNVTGRLLVGLRWWNYVKPNGEEEWIYESLEDMAEINPSDARIFWTGLYGNLIVWVVFSFLDLLKVELSWFLLGLTAIGMTSANIYGYTQCSKSAKEKMDQMLSGQFASQALDNASFRGWLFEGIKSTFMSTNTENTANRGNNAQSQGGGSYSQLHTTEEV